MNAQIVEYSATAAALTELHARYDNFVFDPTTKDGMAEGKKAYREIQEFWIALEKLRKELKAPALERSRLIDAEAKYIDSDLHSMADPIGSIIKNEEGRKAREEEEARLKEEARIAGIQRLVGDFVTIPSNMAHSSSAKIKECLDIYLDSTPDPAVFMEFVDHAKTEHGKMVTLLKIMYDAALAKENAAKIEAESKAKQDAELAQLRKEKEERDRADMERRREEEARLDSERRAAREREAKERAEHEAKLKAEREEEEKRQAAARAQFEAEQKIREAAERKAMEKRLAKEKVEAEKRAAIALEQAEKSQARTILKTFIERFGKRRELSKVVKAINEFLEE